ncbi:MAG: MarR family winged helix-turn-helix transcriptional regulator [Ruminococcus sp.]
MKEDYCVPIMKKTCEEMERRANEGVKKYRLTLTQAQVTLFLSEKPEKTATQKELENFLQVSHPTTVTIVKSMESKKMVKTSFDEEDRRMKNVELTWGDEDLYEKLRENVDEMEQKLLTGFSEEEKSQFLSFLNRAYKNSMKE